MYKPYKYIFVFPSGQNCYNNHRKAWIKAFWWRISLLNHHLGWPRRCGRYNLPRVMVGYCNLQKKLHPRKLTYPLKNDYFSREYIFKFINDPLIFRGRPLVFRGVHHPNLGSMLPWFKRWCVACFIKKTYVQCPQLTSAPNNHQLNILLDTHILIE